MKDDSTAQGIGQDFRSAGGFRVLAEDDGSSSGVQGVDVREVDVSYPSPAFTSPLPPSPMPVSSSFPSSAVPRAIRARLHRDRQTLVVGSYLDARYRHPASEGNSSVEVVEYL